MSVKRSVITYGVVAIIIAAALIGASVAILPSTITSSSQRTSQTGAQSSQTTSQSQTAVSGPTTPMAVLLTDPPTVPVGTSSLNLTYSNMQVHVEVNGSEEEWIDVNASGTVDLLSLVNVSKTIALVQVPQGSTVNQIRFDVSSVKIDINNTVYNVTTVTKQLIVPIAGGANIQQLTGMLLDLTSNVVEISTGNGSTPVFVLIPNVVAVIKPSSTFHENETRIGTVSNLTEDDRHELQGARGAASAVASLSVSGNTTTFSVTINNTGNVSLALSAIGIHGPFHAVLSQSTSCQNSSATSTNTTTSGSAESGAGVVQRLDDNTSSTTTNSTTTENSTTTIVSGDNKTETHTESFTNTTITEHSDTNSTFTQSTESHSEDGGAACSSGNHEFEAPDQLVFAVNGTTLIPFGGDDIRVNATGIIIQPGTSVTLNFTGIISMMSGDSEGGQSIIVFPTSGATYEVHVILSNDASTVVQTTAT